MKRLVMAGLLTTAVAVALPVEAHAGVLRLPGGIVIASRDDARRGDWRGVGPAYRYGYDRGWREGSDEGYKDGRRNRDADFWREGRYRDGDRGYKGWMGPKWDYVKGYREGYASAYRRAYASARPGWRDRDGYGRYGDDRRDGRYGRRDNGYYPDQRYPDRDDRPYRDRDDDRDRR